MCTQTTAMKYHSLRYVLITPLYVDISHLCAVIGQGELIAFTAYAIAFPSEFLALIDTYAAPVSLCICMSPLLRFVVVSVALATSSLHWC